MQETKVEDLIGERIAVFTYSRKRPFVGVLLSVGLAPIGTVLELDEGTIRGGIPEHTILQASDVLEVVKK